MISKNTRELELRIGRLEHAQVRRQQIDASIAQYAFSQISKELEWHYPPSIVAAPGKIEDYDLDKLNVPQRHQSGVVRAARFDDFNYVRLSTRENTDSMLHSLVLAKDGQPTLYTRSLINPARTRKPDNIRLDRIEDMVAVPDFLHAIGRAAGLVEREQLEGWPNAFTRNELLDAIRIDDNN